MGNKIGELKVKFDKARTILSTVPGIDMSHTEQLDYYQTLLKQYKHENELLTSYKEMCNFDISQLEQEPPPLQQPQQQQMAIKEESMVPPSSNTMPLPKDSADIKVEDKTA